MYVCPLKPNTGQLMSQLTRNFSSKVFLTNLLMILLSLVLTMMPWQLCGKRILTGKAGLYF